MNRRATQKLMHENGVVTLVADMTKDNVEANQLLSELGNTGHGIPYMAIFPGWAEPITMDGMITKNSLMARIEEALERSEEYQNAASVSHQPLDRASTKASVQTSEAPSHASQL